MLSIDIQFMLDEEKLPFLTWRPSGLTISVFSVSQGSAEALIRWDSIFSFACFLINTSAKYYENPTMFSLVIAKNIGDVDVFLRTHILFTFCSPVYLFCYKFPQICSYFFSYPHISNPFLSKGLPFIISHCL